MEEVELEDFVVKRENGLLTKMVRGARLVGPVRSSDLVSGSVALSAVIVSMCGTCAPARLGNLKASCVRAMHHAPSCVAALPL